MCGIVGIVSRAGDPSIAARLDAMHATQVHRGPDDEGRTVDLVGDTCVGLAHQRLSILDLSEAGHQPMVSQDGRHVVVFNGEIYNYVELRAELEAGGVRFQSACDTEVLLYALVAWGPSAFARLNGMWAVAWLDRAARRLVLSRDRFGVKPLYHHTGGRRLYFSSEIKAILAGCDERLRVDARVVGRYLAQSLLAAQPQSFFEGVELLPAGTYMTVDLTDRSCSPPRAYWSDVREDTLAGKSIEERVIALRELFTDCVRLRLRSDVPVGVLLSGGVDSSSIATVMRRALGAGADLHMISAVSDVRRFDEQPFIDRMTGYLGCASHKVHLRLSPRQSFQLLDEVTWANDEPLNSFSSVAHYLLMREAKALGITVILSGQGADELLCGYKKYLAFHLQALALRGDLKAVARTLLEFASRGTVLSQFTYSEAKRYFPGFARGSNHEVLGPRVRGADGFLDVGLSGTSILERQLGDLYRFSVPALVQYEDRMSMAFAREIRLPFLDYRLASMLIPTPVELKLKDGWTKWLLRKAMEPFLPPEVAWRKDKMGFANPQSIWLRSELRPEIERMFREPMLTAKLGLVDQEALARRYARYCAQGEIGRIDYREIFGPIALETWARRFERWIA